MDRNSFWREVIEIVKHHKRSPDPVEHLSEQRMSQLESNIFAHIEQQFPKDSTAAVKSDNAAVTEPRKKSLPERVKSLLRLPFPTSLQAHLLQAHLYWRLQRLHCFLQVC